MQLLIPAACAWEYHRREQRYGYYACLIWIAENLLNIARYIERVFSNFEDAHHGS